MPAQTRSLDTITVSASALADADQLLFLHAGSNAARLRDYSDFIADVSVQVQTHQWKGQWLTATAYVVGDEVANNGDAYIATAAHTSAAATEPGIGADWATVWDLFASGGSGVSGPASSTDRAIATWNGTSATALRNTGVTIDASNNLTVPGQVKVSATDTSALINVFRNDATPTAGDLVGMIAFTGYDSAGSSSQNYAQIRAYMADPTSASEDGYLSIWTTGAGTTAERMRIDGNGNVGFSSTDIEAWDSSLTALEFFQSSIVAHTTQNTIWLTSNAYASTGWKYKATQAAAQYFINNGAHTFRVVPSGTIDTAITWTTALTIENGVKAGVSIGGEYLTLSPFDNGSSYGRFVSIGRNTNASTPAAGILLIYNKDGTGYRVWADGSGDVRVGTVNPTNANDTSGTVVGTQTSDIRLKQDVTTFSDYSTIRSRLSALDLHSYRFIEDSQRGDKLMTSLVIREEDRGSWWSMNDHRADNMAALDEANLFGHLVGGWQDHETRIAELESELDQLKRAA